MRKEEQTQKVLLELCDLTLNFTRAYQPRYYYQYRGDVYDLAMEFYCEFLTPKSRKGTPESLLDKFNPEITTLPYLVKVSTIRKLIDRSRSDKYRLTSLDKLIEDGVSPSFTLDFLSNIEDKVDLTEVSMRSKIITEFNKLEPLVRNTLFAELLQCKSPICDFLSPVLKTINGHPVQQITDKTIVLYVKAYRKCLNFDNITGIPRGNLRPFVLQERNLGKYHSGFSKTEFEDYNNSLTSYKF